MNFAAIVPQRALYDCLPAALATTLGWTYERARAVLGAHVTERGTFLMPLCSALLPERIAATYLLPRDHPYMNGRTDPRWRGLLVSPTEIRDRLQGHRAIVTVPGLGPEDQAGPEFGHALAWDGHRAIHCGSTGQHIQPAREIDIGAYPIWEALLLTQIPSHTPKAVAVPASHAEDNADLAAIFDRYERVFLGFSGGKESVTLAHMLAPWRERVTLLWVNTGHMAPHMVEFVRAYRERGWTLEELHSPSLLEHWQTAGTPAEVFPLANIHGLAEPRLQPWLHCCGVIRQEPINVFLRAQDGPACFINGQRRQDISGATVAGLRSQLPPTVEIAMPLTDWSGADVMAYVEKHGLTLPPQYAEGGYPDSLECLPCPAPMNAARMRYLRKHHPAEASIAVAASKAATDAALAAVSQIILTAHPQEAA